MLLLACCPCDLVFNDVHDLHVLHTVNTCRINTIITVCGRQMSNYHHHSIAPPTTTTTHQPPGDSNPEYGAKLMHWAMVQGIAARLAEQSAQDTEQGQQAHALIERMAVEVPSLSPRETDDDVGTDDVTTTAATEVSVSEAAALEPAAVDPELGIANGREGALQPKHSTMESAKSADKRAWRSESRVCCLGVETVCMCVCVGSAAWC